MDESSNAQQKYIPHDETTRAVIRMCVKWMNDEIELQEKGLILDKDQDQGIIDGIVPMRYGKRNAR